MNAATATSGSCQLATLLQGEYLLPAELDRELSGIELDSRRISRGDLFMACNGAGHDGRDFIDAAIARGAAAVLAEADEHWNRQELRADVPVIPVQGLSRVMGRFAARFYAEPAQSLRMVGITGTNGKTSISHLAAQLFSSLGYQCGIIGTLGYGKAGSSLVHDAGVPATTPDAVSLQRQLASLRDERCDTVVMEVSSHGLQQYRVNVDDFSVAVFSNLSRDHLDYHGDMQTYATAKRRLFTGNSLKVAVLNADDRCSRETSAMLPAGVRVLNWSLSDPAADVVSSGLRFLSSGMALDLVTPWGEFSVSTRLLGSFNASNLLAALTTVLACEAETARFDAGRIVSATGALVPVPGRMQMLPGAWPVTVVIDYAHTPDALEKALSAVREHCQGRLWIVFGCGGDRDRGKRPEMAAVAERLADQLVLTSDNPRSEPVEDIIAGMLQGVSTATQCIIEPDRRKAIDRALSAASQGDVILVAGKGHEDYQESAGQRVPFSDAAVASQLLAERYGSPQETAGEVR